MCSSVHCIRYRLNSFVRSEVRKVVGGNGQVHALDATNADEPRRLCLPSLNIYEAPPTSAATTVNLEPNTITEPRVLNIKLRSTKLPVL